MDFLINWTRYQFYKTSIAGYASSESCKLGCENVTLKCGRDVNSYVPYIFRVLKASTDIK